MQWPFVLKSEHVTPQDSPSQQIHQVAQKGDICKDFELPLFTSLHFACGRNEGFRTDPIGINKYAKHASPEDTGKQFYLCTAVGIFTKDCWDRKPFPGSMSGLAYCFFLSFSVISVQRFGLFLNERKTRTRDHITKFL